MTRAVLCGVMTNSCRSDWRPPRRGDARDDPVGRIEDHVRAAAEAAIGRAFPPRQDGLAAVVGGAEVHRRVRRGRVEVDDVARLVEDQHPALPRPRRGRQEEEPFRLRCRPQDRQLRRPEIRPRVEVAHAARTQRGEGRARVEGAAGNPEKQHAGSGARTVSDELGSRPARHGAILSEFGRGWNRPAVTGRAAAAARATGAGRRRARSAPRRRAGGEPGPAKRGGCPTRARD